MYKLIFWKLVCCLVFTPSFCLLKPSTKTVVSVLTGESANIQCSKTKSILGGPKSRCPSNEKYCVRWKKNRKLFDVKADSRMHQLDYDDEKKAYGLIIDSVVGEDSGEYECGSFSRGRVTLNVYDRLDSPKITDPTHQMDGFSLNVIENEVVTLVCQLIFHENGRNRSREMMPILSWLNDAGEELPSSKRGRQPLDGQQFLYSRLTFTATNEYNHGNITCIGKYAGVSLGIQSTSIRLNVELYSAQFLKRFINWKILLATGLTVVVVLVIIVAFNIAPVFRTRNMKSEEIGSSIVHFDPNSESMVIKDDPKCLMNQSDRNKLIGERGCF